MPKQTVLIIEDEPELQEILTYNLEALGIRFMFMTTAPEGSKPFKN